MTDLGNIERFCERNRGKFMCSFVDGWSWWDGRRWCHDGIAERLQIAIHRTVRAIQDESAAIAGTDLDVPVGACRPKGIKGEMLSEVLREWGRASEMNAKVNQFLRGAWVYFRPVMRE
jgi:hypothetical protein